jgi:hypothetical protein
MNTLSRCVCLLIALLSGAGMAWAQSGLDAEVLRLYGGTYAVDCANSQSPRLKVERQALHVEQGQRRLTARQDVMAAYSYFGQSAPPGFLVALEGQVQRQMVMTFLVYGDARGQYATLDGHPDVLANLGPLARVRFNSCDAAANQRAQGMALTERQAQLSARAPLPASQATSPSDLVRDARFRAAWLKTLGPLSREAWLARMNGPAPELRREQLLGQDWLVAAFCKPHDCGDNNAVVIYDEATGRVHAVVHRAGRTGLLGAPPAPLGADLQRIWRREWRQGR